MRSVEKVTVYSKPNCPGCVSLKAQLEAEYVDYTEVVLGKDMSVEDFKEMFPKVRSVPHVVYD